MAEASSRILVDRSVVRLDGRPIFSFGPRILLTAPNRFDKVLQRLAYCGFNVVGSPPCSPSTIPLLEAFFDAAERAKLLVILIVDPRLEPYGGYMANHFRDRVALHSYLLPPRPATPDALDRHLRDRDSIRAHDLFHPIWMPLSTPQFDPTWLRAQDIFCVSSQTRIDSSSGRLLHQQPGYDYRVMQAKSRQLPPRPGFCADLPVGVGDHARAIGMFDEDPLVSHTSRHSLEWFPWMSNIHHIPRRDFLGPDPEMMRLQLYALLQAGSRGVLLDFYEAMTGPSPFTGHDRFCEATILAQEIALVEDFFAEGRIEPIELDSGHPRLSAVAIRHGREILVVLRMEGYEEDFFVDEAYMERTEISLRIENGSELKAWRMDFPQVRPLEMIRDSAGALRFLAGPLELTGLILLSPGSQRADDLSSGMETRLERVAHFAVDGLRARLMKVEQIERELNELSMGIDNLERLGAIRKIAREAEVFLQMESLGEAYKSARKATRYLRQIIKYQIARALATPVFDKEGIRLYLRSNYYTLPRFYREGVRETSKAFTDLT